MQRATLMLMLVVGAVLVWPGVGWADTRGIRVDGKSPEEFIAAQTGKSYAVVIGINDYEKVPRLTYAKADAASIARTLKQRGFAVTELYDKQASRRNILSELGDKLVDRVKEEDRVLIFYAGHGETKQRTGGKEIGYLLPVGGEQDALAETAIPMSMIRDLADALPAKQVLFLVDVCYGGIAGQQFRSLPKYNVDYLKAITRERGRQLITAGGPKQKAMEGPEWGHSVFTYYLLEGLDKGRADLNDDGIIPATELYAYLDERVFGAASLKGHEQRPVMWTMAAEKGEFVFFTNRGSQVGKGAAPAPVPSAALSQAQQELNALEEQERQAEEAQKLAALQAQIEQKKKKLEVASLPPSSTPPVSGMTSPDEVLRELYGKRYAVVVGINKYAKGGMTFPNLRAPVNDAGNVAAKLRDLKFDAVVELLDEQATKQSVIGALGKLSRKAQENDLVMFFFSGHGDTRGDYAEQMGFILPHDYDPEAPYETSIAMTELQNLSKLMKAKHVLYAMDSCFSGGILLYRAIPKVPDEGRLQYLRNMTTNKARTVLTACNKNEVTNEAGGIGLFTQALLEGLSGKADLDNTGFITSTELGRYIQRRVPEFGVKQNPQVGRFSGGDGEGDIVLTVLRPLE